MFLAFRTDVQKMTEVASPLPPPSIGGPVLSVRKYEAGPPPSVVAELQVRGWWLVVSANPRTWGAPLTRHLSFCPNPATFPGSLRSVTGCRSGLVGSLPCVAFHLDVKFVNGNLRPKN